MWGFIDREGGLAIVATYDQVSDFQGPLAQAHTRDGRIVYVDQAGEVVKECGGE